MSYELPSQIDRMLFALYNFYKSKNNKALLEIIVNGSAIVTEGCEYDNMDGGISGHALTLRLPETIFFEAMNNKQKIESDICSHLNTLTHIPREYICNVFLEINLREESNWRENTGLLQPRNNIAISKEDINEVLLTFQCYFSLIVILEWQGACRGYPCGSRCPA